jgi:8-oxo-dGTP diphosphatase
MNFPHPRVGVGIIVVKKEAGKTFVMLHRRLSDHGNGYWGSGGGHLDLGESLVEGALRELAEEAGSQVKVDNVTFLGVMNFTQMQPKHYVDISFRADWVSGEPENCTPQKTADWQWFDLEHLPSPLFPPLENYLKALASGQQFFDSGFDSAIQ